jgi:FtsP/CotA-like multicopper oxidase with cupredoxin domain
MMGGARLLLDRRRFIAGAATLPLAPVFPALAQDAGKLDYTLTIAPVSIEIAPGQVIKTVAYNGTVPGPLIRAREGQRVTIDITNRSPDPDIVHWHGLAIPSAADGAMEEGAPMLAPGATQRVSFIAKPAGTRWYHSHAMAKTDLTKSLYSGQYGFFYIEPAHEPGAYDREVFIALHHWQPQWVSLQDIRKGPPPNNGLEVVYGAASFNAKALGHGEPIRVKEGERVLFRIVNASATQETALALPGHRFTIIALDGNPLGDPQASDSLFLAPGERVDALCEMNQKGVWIFGSVIDDERAKGMGAVVEYAGASGTPQWQAPADKPRMIDYTMFGGASPARAPDAVIDLVFDKIPGGRGGYNRWTINGKSFPDTDPIMVKQGKRYRLALHNLAADMHPIHLHRHSFEVTNYMGKAMSGLIKDVMVLPGRHDAEIDFTADNPGPTLFHCHMQDHQDFGFMTLVKYG